MPKRPELHEAEISGGGGHFAAAISYCASDSRLHQLDDAADRTHRIIRLHEVEVALGLGWAEVRDRALVDAMGTRDDAALRGLPEYFGEAYYRHGA